MYRSLTIGLTAATCAFVCSAPAEPETPPTAIALDLTDGSHITGSTELRSIHAQTSYGRIDIAMNRIVSVAVSNDHETAIFHLRNGDRVRGTLDGKPFVLNTCFGEASAPIDRIAAVQVYRGAAAPAGFRKDMVLHLTFDKEQGLTVPDNSGSNNSGEAIRGDWTAEGRSGGGYRLDGENDYLGVSGESSFDFGSRPFTIALWVKPESVDTRKKRKKRRTQVLLSKYEGGKGCQWLLGLTDKGMLKLVTSSKPERGWVQSKVSKSNTMKNGCWHHVAVRKFGREAIFYVDGRPLTDDGSRVGSIGSGDEPVRIGACRNREGRLDDFFGGTIDDVMIWRRALSESEIEWLTRNRE